MKLEYIKNNVNFVSFRTREREKISYVMSYIGKTNWNTLRQILNCLSTVKSISFHVISMETVLLKAIVKNFVINRIVS